MNNDTLKDLIVFSDEQREEIEKLFYSRGGYFRSHYDKERFFEEIEFLINKDRVLFTQKGDVLKLENIQNVDATFNGEHIRMVTNMYFESEKEIELKKKAMIRTMIDRAHELNEVKNGKANS